MVTNIIFYRYQLVVVNVSWSSETDRLARLLSPSTPFSIKRQLTTLEMPPNPFTASTSPLDRRDPPSPTSWDYSESAKHLSTLSLLLLLHLMRPLYSSWLPTPAALSANTSETTACTASSFTTISLNKQSPTVRCLSCSDVLQVVRLTLVMSSIFTLVCSSVRLRWISTTELALWLLFPLLRLRLVMSLHIFQQMSSLSLMDRFSLKPNFSTKVSAQPLTSVFLYPVSDQLPKSKLWNKSPVHWNSSLPNIVRSLHSLSLVLIWTLQHNNYLTEVRSWQNCLNKSNTFLFRQRSKFASCMPV